MVYDPDNKPVNPYAAAYQNFIEQTKDHVLTVTLDNGLDRQMRVGAPDTSSWSWRVVTWSGYLATFGDIADGFMFTRDTDMMEFFEVSAGSKNYYSDGSPSIDFRYWAKKLSGGRSHDMKEFSESVFIQSVVDTLDENEDLGTEALAEYDKIVEVAKRVCARNGVDYDEYLDALWKKKRGAAGWMIREDVLTLGSGLANQRLWKKTEGTAAKTIDSFLNQPVDVDNDDEMEYFGLPIPEQSPAERREEILEEARDHSDNEQEAFDWLRDNTEIFGDDCWEMDLRDYDVHFIFACYAIELTVRLWREYEKSPEALAHRNPGDSYVLVEGGLVQNNPALPVFDLDVLDSDVPNQESASEALDLYERINEHPQARLDLARTLSDAADFVRAYGYAEDIETIEGHEAKRLAKQQKEKVA